MQKPLPGPNLLLPALRLSDPPDLDHVVAYKRREAKWKALISQEHKKWCLCGSYLNHFLKPSESLKNTETCSEDGGDGGEGATGGDRGGDGDITDEDMFIAGLEEM